MMAVVAIVGVVSSVGVSRTRSIVEHAKVTRAIADLRTLSVELNSMDVLPATLAAAKRGGLRDPWGRAYAYLVFPPRLERSGGPPQGARKDRFLVPINSRFDLYSLGPDGKSTPPLTARDSRDDIVVANDGAFVGRALDY